MAQLSGDAALVAAGLKPGRFRGKHLLHLRTEPGAPDPELYAECTSRQQLDAWLRRISGAIVEAKAAQQMRAAAERAEGLGGAEAGGMVTLGGGGADGDEPPTPVSAEAVASAAAAWQVGGGAATSGANYWRQGAFLDLFADVTLRAPPVARPELGADNLAESLMVLCGGLERLEASPMLNARQQSAVRRAAELARGAARLCSRLPLSKRKEVRREAAAATFERWLEVIVHDIEELDAGEMLAVPVAWPAEGPDGRVRGEHACLLVVQRRDTAAGDDLSVAVCNTGDGAEYHPWRPASDTAQPQRARAVALHEISRSRLTCSAVWFAMFRALAFQRATSEASSKKAKRKKEKKQKSKDTEIVAAAAHELRESDSSDENADDKDAERRRSGKDAGMPSRRQGARLLYQTLLPFMNRRAFLANVPAGGGSELQDTCPEVVFQTEPFSGDWSRVACALEAVRVCLLWSGLAAGEVAHVLLLLKWGLASVATSELASSTSYSPDG